VRVSVRCDIKYALFAIGVLQHTGVAFIRIVTIESQRRQEIVG
jgi:hypothetical protein